MSEAAYEAAMIAATCAVIIPGSFLFGVFVEWQNNRSGVKAVCGKW